MKKSLEIIVFLCGAAVMMLELIGSRILAPHIGSSIFVWTSLIGIIMGALSLGYWIGGKVSDKNPNYAHFSLIIFISALLVLLTAICKEFFLSALTSSIYDIKISATIAATFLFGPASFLLGMVSPYAVRLKIKELKDSGKTVGNLYAISTLGSIAGTFLAGFILISYLGSTKILFLIVLVLLLASVLACKEFFKIKAVSLLLLLLLFVDYSVSEAKLRKTGYIDVDTPYQRIIIADGFSKKDVSRPVRYLITDAKSTESMMYLDSDELALDYEKYYNLIKYFNPEFKKILMIGGAAYSYPKDYLKRYPEAKIDVVEIDPKMTDLARKYFNLKDDPRLNIFHEDGRTYLNSNNKKYDGIFLDVFKSYYIPFQLTTKEVVKKMYDSLNNGGVVMANIISAVDGNKGRLLRAEYYTYKEYFPQIYLFVVHNTDKTTDIQNIMLVAIKSNDITAETKDDETKDLLSHIYTKEISKDVPIFTDDFAPAESYINEVF